VTRDEKRRQQAVQRRAARRKARKRAPAHAAPTSARGVLRSAATWPWHECLVSADWHRAGELVQIVVARRSSGGEIAAGVFLVDLCCLGVKDAFARLFPSPAEYERDLRGWVTDTQRLVRADPNLAAKIVREGITYARQLGFGPHRDYAEAAVLLRGTDPTACDAPIPLGKGGKPFFVNGPRDDVARILAKLEKAVGPGNFDYLIGLGAESAFLGDDEDDT
jgi:hypothetical protein